MTTKVEISRGTIVFTLGIILGTWFLYQIRTILIMLFVSFLLMNAIAPVVKLGRKIKIPVMITVFALYVLLLVAISSIIASIIPAVVQQSRALMSQLPLIVENIGNMTNLSLDNNLFNSQLSSLPSNIFKIASSAFSNIINILAIFFMTYYLTLERSNMHKYLVRLFGDHTREQQAENFVRDLERRVGGWIRAELVLMFVVGLLTYIGLLLLKIPYALPLAVLAGILEIIPNIGPTVAAIPAILVALSISPVAALGTLALNVIVQQLESNFIVPKVMQKNTGINPLVTIILLFTGFTLLGIMGAVLAIPIYLTIVSFVNNIK